VQYQFAVLGVVRSKWEGTMASHKYAVGQTVLITHTWYPGLLGLRSPIPGLKKGERFQVVRLLPEEGQTPQCRSRERN
jgi:hypothetical protein